MKKRFDGFFIDTILISLWICIAVIVVLGVLFQAFPVAQKWLGAQFTQERMVMGTGLIFFGSTAYRLLINYKMSPWIIPFSYVAVQIGYAFAWTHEMMHKPVNILYAPVLPTAFLAMACIPLSYVWERIKPLPSTKRRPRRAAN